jgi:hypothetical protein
LYDPKPEGGKKMKYNTLWKYSALCVLALCLLMPTGYSLQSKTAASQTQPKVLWILEEDIKPGKIQTYKNLQAQYFAIYNRAKFAYNWTGTIPDGTRSSTATFYIGLNSLGEMDNLYQEFLRIHTEEEGDLFLLDSQAGDVVAGQRESFGTFHPELSIEESGTAGGVFRSGFVQVVKVQVKADKAQQWAGTIAETTSALKKAGSAKGVLTYEIISGDAPGTFLFFYPSSSPDEASSARDQQHASIKALGGDVADKFAKANSENVVQEQRTIHYINPKMTLTGKGR